MRIWKFHAARTADLARSAARESGARREDEEAGVTTGPEATRWKNRGAGAKSTEVEGRLSERENDDGREWGTGTGEGGLAAGGEGESSGVGGVEDLEPPLCS